LPDLQAGFPGGRGSFSDDRGRFPDDPGRLRNRPDGSRTVQYQVVHVDDLFGAAVSLDFVFHVPSIVVEALRSANLEVIEHVEREPYEGVEYPSRRCYLLARAASW
jgi:hypothetical protein